MKENSILLHRKIYFVAFLVCCLILMIFYYDDTILSYGAVYPTEEISSTEEISFLVSSSKCKIIDLDPFNKDAKRFHHQEKYKPCRTLELLTYVTKNEHSATLHVDNEVIPSYSAKGVSCCYSNVTRKNSSKDPDGSISISACKFFENNISIFHEPVMVKCADLHNLKRSVYENVHVATTIKDDVRKKIDNFDNTTRPFSLLFVGIDSISRLNLIRSLPNTYKYLVDNEWVPLNGYNKMDDNTFPNLMAILTGFNQSYSYSVCNPLAVGKLDDCPMLWYDYKKLGYITGYAEDEGWINTFNYKKKGFKIPPTDYYFRPYILATEKLNKTSKDGMTYCTGPETAGERIMNVARDFAVTFKACPNFGFFWMNSFSHNRINSPSGMDLKVRGFLDDLTTAGVTENSIVIFISDHGIRFGDIRLTDTGWLEERLPFIFVSFPKTFKENFTKEYQNFRNNSHKLTSPYDIHMTLKHILVLSGYNYSITPSNGCPSCKSLFEEIDAERSCEDAGIEQHWCTCSGYTSVTLTNSTKVRVLNYVLQELHDVIRSRNSDHSCAKYSVDQIKSSRISQTFSYRNETFLLLKFQTNPKAVWESTISFVGDISTSNFSLSGDISRLDSYSEHSKCVSDAYLKKYCYCLTNGLKI